MNPQAASSINLAQWVPMAQRWLGLGHALVVGHSQQALSLLNGVPQSLTLFKAGSPAASPDAHAPAAYAAAHTRPWLISEPTGPVTFHQASLPSESGLLPAIALTACWPGINPLGQHQASALSLDDACAQASAEHAWASPTSMFVDWLPACQRLAADSRLCSLRCGARAQPAFGHRPFCAWLPSCPQRYPATARRTELCPCRAASPAERPATCQRGGSRRQGRSTKTAKRAGADLCQAERPAQRLLPHAKALAFALQSPLHRGVCAPLGGDGLHGCGARVPLDDESHRVLAFIGLRGDGLHQLERTKARIGAHQQKGVQQARCHGQDALEVVLALVCRVLDSRAQNQLQTIVLGAQSYSSAL